jgi:hypothetical protein
MILRNSLRQLDQLLRGEATKREVLQTGDLAVQPGQLFLVNIVLGMLAGFCLGWFALVNRQLDGTWQVLASMVKVPALFLLTFLITLPSLYVFNALFQSRLGFRGVVKLLLATLAIINALIASLGPIVAFFSLTTESYGFMILFTVFVFGVSGLFGIYFLIKTLHQMTDLLDEQAMPAPSMPEVVNEEQAQPDDAKSIEKLYRDWGVQPTGRHLEQQRASRVRAIFSVWMFLFVVVGMQMAWILRPFLGNPSDPFMWFRPRNSNFFQAVWQTLQGLVGVQP